MAQKINKSREKEKKRKDKKKKRTKGKKIVDLWIRRDQRVVTD